jgi:membrane associated rhomboid family serine protease
MRLLRELPTRAAADQLRDALDDAGIACELVESDDGSAAVWVIDEGHNAQARELTTRWLDGDGEGYAAAVRRGAARREMKARVAQRAELQRAALEAQLRAMMRPRPTPLTWGLLALSVAVATLTQLAFSSTAPFVSVRPPDAFVPMIAELLIVDPYHYVPIHNLALGPVTLTWLGLPWSQPWRLLTPVLVHFGFLHILFNALWLRDLGRVIEARHGTLYLGSFVLVSGVLSNVAQFEITESPMFGGLSGVVYGLLGLIWLGGKLRPRLGYGLTRATVQFMLLWLAMGFLGNFGVANYCHLGGLVVGMAWAYGAYLVERRRTRGG